MNSHSSMMSGLPAFKSLGKDVAFQKEWSLSDKKYQLMQDLAKQTVWRAEGAQIIRTTNGQ